MSKRKGKSLTWKIIEQHLVDGKMEPGQEIGIRIDQTLTQDATGTMAYLHFESMGLPSVKTKRSVSYVDHNTLQTGFMNADDHIFLQTVAARFGVYFSRPGNGICHQVHLERFGVPGMTLLGSDSHTPTGGGIGMLAIGAGGLDVAVAMGGAPFYLPMPKIVKVVLKGKLQPFVSAKDVILELLRRISVKGGVGKIYEYSGPGVKTLSVPERATITNMGTELGATSSIFPSDEVTRAFLKAQKRLKDWRPLSADPDAEYDEVIELDLSTIEPLVAQPSLPDNVIEVRKLKGLKVNQVCIGSCTNSSYRDLMMMARLLKGKKIHPEVSCTLSPGSRQVLQNIERAGALRWIIDAGVRLLECTCGPCIGMGQTPGTGSISVRTFNRNFKGRSGLKDDRVYLASVETAVAAAIYGKFVDPRTLGKAPRITMPQVFTIDDGMIIPPPPPRKRKKVKVIKGPNIKYAPVKEPLPESFMVEVLLKVGDNITTDHIMPAGAKILPLRSNIPVISEYVFSGVDPEFSKRALQKGGGIIVGGENYGQGSSREHAALAPMYLGIKAVLARSFARIHWQNLVNFGILPLVFVDSADYEQLKQGDILDFSDVRRQLLEGDVITAKVVTQNRTVQFQHSLSERQKQIILAGGLLNYTRQKAIK
ncbi:aconitate hydratase [Candidatus Sumerlaeota bacterium]|nr:aconitate hydratase [Candidatus Sumerlaeota bacterium]